MKVIKEAITSRDTAYKAYKSNKIMENKLNFKNLKYKMEKLIKAEAINEEVKYFNENDSNPHKIWSKAKNKIFKMEEALIDRVIDKNELVIGSKKTCEVINSYFIDKVKKLKSNLKPQFEDPMINYNKSIKTPVKLLMFK